MADKVVDLVNNIDDQQEYLERNMQQLNIVVGAILDIHTELKIKKKSNGRTNCLEVVDDRDYRKVCGIMKHAFKKVTIGDFGMRWKENGVIIELDFFYEHIDGGRNGAKFCTISIENDFVKIW